MPIPKTGKVYKIKGKEFTLYPISTLVEVLNEHLPTKRTPQTIRLWERKAIIPPPLFKISGIRLYTAQEIKIIVETAIKYNLRQGSSISKTFFSEEVWDKIEEVRKSYFEEE